MRKELLLVGLILLLGCRTKLLDESTVNVDPTQRQFKEIDPISSAQKINASAKANNGQFNIFVYLAKDRAEVEKDMEQDKAGAKVLAHKLKVSEADLQATIPANEKAVVALTSCDGKKAEVKLKISN